MCRLESKKAVRLAVAEIATVVAGIANTPVAGAQHKTESFDVISVKTAIPGQRGRGFITNDPGRMRMTNVTLAECILEAYGIQSAQLIARGLPQDRYEILATAPSHPSPVLDERYQAMMQAMLADRFRLKLHRESKVMPVYALEIAKGGPKLKVSSQPGLSTRSTPGHVTATGATLFDLANYLTRRVGRLVVDLTALKGLYDFTLDWEPGEGDAFAEPPDPNRPHAAEPANAPSLFTALQEQLGLKLESKKVAVETLVVDHWERASPN